MPMPVAVMRWMSVVSSLSKGFSPKGLIRPLSRVNASTRISDFR